MKKLSLIVVLALAIAAGFAQVVINVSPTEITGLDYVYGQGPSDYQILTVSGSGLEPYKSLIIDVMVRPRNYPAFRNDDRRKL